MLLLNTRGVLTGKQLPGLTLDDGEGIYSYENAGKPCWWKGVRVCCWEKKHRCTQKHQAKATWLYEFSVSSVPEPKETNFIYYEYKKKRKPLNVDIKSRKCNNFQSWSEMRFLMGHSSGIWAKAVKRNQILMPVLTL